VLAKSILTGLATTQDLLDLAVRSTNDDHKMVLKIVHIGFFI
jgi:preprotein translocase subunit Sss1